MEELQRKSKSVRVTSPETKAAPAPAIATAEPDTKVHLPAAVDAPWFNAATVSGPTPPAAAAPAKPKHVVKKSKRKPPKLEPYENDNSVTAYHSDSRTTDGRGGDRYRPSSRVVHVDREDSGSERTTVIRRERGGLFENLFGGGRGYGD